MSRVNPPKALVLINENIYILLISFSNDLIANLYHFRFFNIIRIFKYPIIKPITDNDITSAIWPILYRTEEPNRRKKL